MIHYNFFNKIDQIYVHNMCYRHQIKMVFKCEMWNHFLVLKIWRPEYIWLVENIFMETHFSKYISWPYFVNFNTYIHWLINLFIYLFFYPVWVFSSIWLVLFVWDWIYCKKNLTYSGQRWKSSQWKM